MMRRKNAAIKDYGDRGVTIVLLHGFLASSRYWTKLQPYLSDAGYRVISIDLLGFGRAPKPHDSDYSYDEHVSYVHSSIKSLRLNAPFVLVGHSMGALIAARYSRMYPRGISSLILLHPPLYNDMHEAYATLRNTSKLYRFLLDSQYRRIGWILLKTFAHYHLGSHARTAREKSLQNVIEKAEAFDDLKTLRTKTLLVVGSKDRVEYGKNVASKTLSASILVITEDVTHHSPIQEPQLIQEKIIQFIQ